MRQSRLTLRCAAEADVRALRDQIDDGTVRVPGQASVEAGSAVEVDVELPGGVAALITGMCGVPGPLGVAIEIDPLTPNAREAIDRAVRELDPPTRRNDGYGAEPETARMPKIPLPAEAFRDDRPAIVKRPPPPPLPPVPLLSKAPRPLVASTIPTPNMRVPPDARRPAEPVAPPPLASPETAEELLAAGKLADALVLFDRRAKLSTDDRVALVAVELIEGLLARDRGDRFEAAQRFEAALAIDPDDARAAHHLTEIRRAVVEARLAGLTKLVDRDKP